MRRLLHNNHNVYILGAGFSHDAGLPLISDFLVRMRDSHEWLENQVRNSEAVAIDKVLDFRLNAASAAYWVNLDLENIEELFSLASASTTGISKPIRLAIAATLDHARKTGSSLKSRMDVRSSAGLFDASKDKYPNWLSRTSEPIDPNGKGAYYVGTYALHAARLLGMLKDGKPQGENTFITFNYDTILEDALHELRIPMTYGSKLDERFSASKIPVFKLHGSVNWARPKGNASRIKVFKDYDELVTLDHVPELVPPTWKKIFKNEMESIWGEAIKKLKTATRIIIIGFSMPPTDMHFKYLLAAGLRENISLRQVLFVNPDPKLEPRVKELLREAYIDSGRIAFVKGGFSQFTSLSANQTIGGIGLSQLGRPIEDSLSYHVLDNQG
jgi:hypothetical protein